MLRYHAHLKDEKVPGGKIGFVYAGDTIQKCFECGKKVKTAPDKLYPVLAVWCSGPCYSAYLAGGGKAVITPPPQKRADPPLPSPKVLTAGDKLAALARKLQSKNVRRRSARLDKKRSTDVG